MGHKRRKSKVDMELLEMFDEIEKRTEDRERALEEKRLKLELEMEEKRQKREQEQDDRMLNMFSTFLQQMSSLLHPPLRQEFQTPLYPGHSSMEPYLHGTYNLFPPNPPYFSSQNTTAASSSEDHSFDDCHYGNAASN